MLDFTQGVEKVKKHMKLAFNIEDFNITMAKQEKDQTNEREVWRYNIEFYVGSAKQWAYFHEKAMGFKLVGYS